MTNWNRKARWMTGSLVVAGTLVLAGCNGKDKGATPTSTSSAATNATDSQTSSVRDDATAASATQQRKICTIAWKQISGRGWITTTCGWGQA
jgi:outer membrane murein-binding lipoprotein Lpp